MSGPPHDPGVDPDDDDQDMADVRDDHEEDEVGGVAERRADPHVPHGAPIPPFARRGRTETKYRMELGSQLCGLISDVGI